MVIWYWLNRIAVQWEDNFSLQCQLLENFFWFVLKENQPRIKTLKWVICLTNWWFGTKFVGCWFHRDIRWEDFQWIVIIEKREYTYLVHYLLVRNSILQVSFCTISLTQCHPHEIGLWCSRFGALPSSPGLFRARLTWGKFFFLKLSHLIQGPGPWLARILGQGKTRASEIRTSEVMY